MRVPLAYIYLCYISLSLSLTLFLCDVKVTAPFACRGMHELCSKVRVVRAHAYAVSSKNIKPRARTSVSASITSSILTRLYRVNAQQNAAHSLNTFNAI